MAKAFALTARKNTWVNDRVVMQGVVLCVLLLDDDDFERNERIETLTADESKRFIDVIMGWPDWELVPVALPSAAGKVGMAKVQGDLSDAKAAVGTLTALRDSLRDQLDEATQQRDAAMASCDAQVALAKDLTDRLAALTAAHEAAVAPAPAAPAAAVAAAPAPSAPPLPEVALPEPTPDAPAAASAPAAPPASAAAPVVPVA